MTTKNAPGRPSKGPRVKHSLRLPLALDEALRQRAEAHGRTLNDELVAVLTAALSSTPGRVAETYTVNAGGVPVRVLEPLAH